VTCERYPLSKFRSALPASIVCAVLFVVTIGGGCVLVGNAATKPLRSPRAAANGGGAVMEQSVPALTVVAPVPSQSIATAAAPLGVASNRTVKATLAWDASPDHASISNYTVWFGGVSHVYTNSVNAGTNLSVTITNLAPNTRYYFAASATSKQGIVSPMTPEIFWPLPVTNYVTAIVSRRTNLTAPGTVIWSQTIANPPGESLFFSSAISVTNDAVTVTRINSSTLKVANTNQP
jgi:hypothetical protein